jgi:phosphatidylinositol-3-phosphatase
MARHHHGRHTRGPRHPAFFSRLGGSTLRPRAQRRPQARQPSRRRLVLVLTCWAALIGLLVSLSNANATNATSRFTPSADAYVSQRKPTSNFGTDSSLRTDAFPSVQRSYVRFDVSQLAGTVTKATLRLYAAGHDRFGYTVRSVTDAQWAEEGITYANAPAVGAVVATSGAVIRHAWTSVDVTAAVQGEGTVSLALDASGSSADAYASRETGTTAPQLVVETLASPTSSSTTTTSSSNTTTTVAAVVSSTSTSTTTSSTSAPTTTTSPYPSGPCGAATTPPATYQHVVWVVMENKTYSQIIGSSNAPYINSLAEQCGLATSFYAETHPSLPNYLAMASGSTQGVTDDKDPSSHPLTAPSIFSQLGTSWRSLEESMPSNCYLSNSGLYAVRHNPAAYFTNIRTQCAVQDQPLSDPPDLSAKFTFITPNLCNDMHSCPTASDVGAETRNGDKWLATWMPKILSSSEYRSGSMAVFLTWDEDDYSTNQHIATLVVSPTTPAGTKVAATFNHYSLLRTTEELVGLTTYLGKAATAASMRHDFNL